VSLQFTVKESSSNGGLLFTKPIVDRLNILDRVVSCLKDRRDPEWIEHPYRDMLGQRLYQMIAGHEDVNDSDQLKSDPLLKRIVRDSSPLDKEARKADLSSSTTIGRMENSIAIKEIHKCTELLVEFYLKRNQDRFEGQKIDGPLIKIDLDPTDIQTHGKQEMSLFNGYYRHTCYLPMMLSDGDNGDVITSFLRPGNKDARYLIVPILKRVIQLIRKKYPKSKFHIRADSGFQCDQLFSFLESQTGVSYIIALAQNSVLHQFAPKPEAKLGDDEKVFGEFGYRAKSWSKFRRVIYQVQNLSFGDTTETRFYATSDPESTPEGVKSDYNRRAELENRIKELKLQCFGYRLSCNGFRANAFRFFLSTLTYLVLQELKKKLDNTDLEKSYVGTIREKIIKVAVHLEEKTSS
jgi:hypothetical protein